MLWQTSPAATEVEQVMIGWLRDALGLPQDLPAPSMTAPPPPRLSAVLTMREKALDWAGLCKRALPGNRACGFTPAPQTHSSVDKAARIAGIGQDNLVKIATDARPCHETRRTGRCDCRRPRGGVAARRGDPVRRRHLDRGL